MRKEKKKILRSGKKVIKFLKCWSFYKLVKSSKKDMEFPRELIKRKFQKNNSIPVFPFFIAIVSSQSVALLAYFAGILMLSQYGKEVGISMLFSAINEINIPQEPVGEPLSQFPWLTVLGNWNEVQLWLDHKLAT